MEPKQQPPYPVRMPPELREELEKSAVANSRSLNAEVVSRLQASIDGAAGLRLPDETLGRLKKAAKKSGRTLDSELYDRMLVSLADLPPAEQRLREQLEKERQENATLRLEAEQHRLDEYKRSTMLYVILDTNGYPISWAELHEHLAGIKKAGGFKPHEMHTHVITPDMESSSRRAQEAVEVARIYREMGGPRMMVYSEGVKEEREAPAAEPARKVIRRTRKPEQVGTESAADALVRKRLVGNLGSAEESAYEKVVVRATPLKPKPISKGPAPSPNDRKPKP